MEYIVQPLLEWFNDHQRELPWRKDRLPYHVWLSEIMLQQTRIEAVKKYYTRFIHELPDVSSLSQVEENRLLKLWEGLGYYSRAKNLKKAAQIIMQEYHGVFPDSYAKLIQLPGIGEYTAGAIASICFHERVTAVDGNVLRVITRLLGSKENVLLPAVKKEIQQKLLAILPEQSGVFNEALMELGETVCLPNGIPECEHCPLKANCIAYKKHLTGEIPVRIKKLKRRKEEKTILLLSCGDRMAIQKKSEQGLLSGMYQLPSLNGFFTEEALYHALTERQLTPLSIVPLGKAKHAFTHIDWYMEGYAVRLARESEQFLWVTPEILQKDYPMPTAFKLFL